MEYSNNQEILGVPKYALYGQEDRVEELNKRIGSRNNIEKKLEPNFDLRPTSTKYDHFPVLDKHNQHLKNRIMKPINYLTNFTMETQELLHLGILVILI